MITKCGMAIQDLKDHFWMQEVDKNNQLCSKDLFQFFDSGGHTLLEPERRSKKSFFFRQRTLPVDGEVLGPPGGGSRFVITFQMDHLFG